LSREKNPIQAEILLAVSTERLGFAKVLHELAELYEQNGDTPILAADVAHRLRLFMESYADHAANAAKTADDVRRMAEADDLPFTFSGPCRVCKQPVAGAGTVHRGCES
jgi:hypothetical protein